MASLIGKLTGLARSPQARQALSQAATKAQQLAKDPATRAKIDQGTARVRSEVAKRRGGSAPTTAAPGAATTPVEPVTPIDPPTPITPTATPTAADDVTPR